MKKKFVSVILAVAMTMSVMTGCTGQTVSVTVETDETKTEEAKIEEAKTGETKTEEIKAEEAVDNSVYLGRGEVGSKWYASCIQGAVTKETEVSLKDDFFTAVNLDYITGLTFKDGEASAGVVMDAYHIMDERAMEIIQKENPESYEGELVKQFYELATDWEARDQAGLTPAMAALEQIQAIRTVDDIAAYEMRTDDINGQRLSQIGVTTPWTDSDCYLVGINTTILFLDDSQEYSEQTESGKLDIERFKNTARYMLQRFGISEEEADEIWEGCMEFETAIAEHMLTLEENYADDVYDRIINIYTLEELKELQGNYPLVDILEASGMGGSNEYILYEPEWLSALSALYVEDNVEMIRDYLLVHYVCNVSSELDRESYDILEKQWSERYGIEGTRSEEQIGLDLVNLYLPEVMDYAYIDEYCSEQERQEVIDMVHEFISCYCKMLEQEEWLSDEMKEYAIEKLNNITIRACFSDTREDYSNLSFKSKADGGTYWEALQAIQQHDLAMQCQYINQKVDPDRWDVSTREVNAYYTFIDNSITILCGMLVGDYSMDQAYEKVLATVGVTTIGHELSHAFDTSGAQFDKNGNYEDWWPEEDYAAFGERADRLVAYMGQIVPYEGFHAVKGDIQKGEMIADLGGIKAALMMAEDREDFDYDLFFRTVARAYADINTKNAADEMMTIDPHPTGNIRTNIMLQNCDEFLETYDIEPGDGMYLSPEDRVNVW